MSLRVLDHPLDRKSLEPLVGPGVYVFSTARGEELRSALRRPDELIDFLQNNFAICYVGKAKQLNQRLKTYRPESAAAAGDWYKSGKLSDIAKSVLVIETPTHFEACLLELFLIRILDPQLNWMSTRPGKLFYVQQNPETRELFATTRRIKGSKNWGCVRSKSDLRDAFDVFREVLDFYDSESDLLKIRPVDSAGFRSTRSRRFSLLTSEKNAAVISNVLKGRRVGLVGTLERAMRSAAQEQQFHHAARLRDAFLALKQLQVQLVRSRKIMRRLRRNSFCIGDSHAAPVREYILSKYSLEKAICSGPNGPSITEDLFLRVMNSAIEIFKVHLDGENDLERLRVNFEFLRLMLWWLDNQPEECSTRSARNV